MSHLAPVGSMPWSISRKIAFRFFFIYILLYISPWTWLDNIIPGIGTVTGYYSNVTDWIAELFNRLWFHFEKTTIVNNGSGDTSLNWQQVFSFLILAAVGALVWSIIDWKRRSYDQAAYWLRTFLRYYIVIMCFTYGFDKLYALQMPFPNQSQLATPLGDFLPMRLTWLFIGSSTPYEVFSGVMEIIAGILLLNRRTITLGVCMATAVFMNVMVLNLCYDIPVKLFSIHLVVFCLYLLEPDSKRLVDFFIYSRPAQANTRNHPFLPKKWMRITRVILKLAFIALFVVKPFIETKDFYRSFYAEIDTKPVKAGLYDVTIFTVNRDTLPALISDTLRWKDMVFEKGGTGSVGSTDTAFRQRYRRGYFSFIPDTVNKIITFKRSQLSKDPILALHYNIPDSNTITLWGSRKIDSLYVVLKRSRRHFQLAERQFHWISEANR